MLVLFLVMGCWQTEERAAVLEEAVRTGMTAHPAGDGIQPEMARHQWAAGKMWLALVEPNEQAWDEAVWGLAQAPLVPVDGPSPMPPLATELELRVHELATDGQLAEDAETQATRYGEILVTCATCHLLLRDGRRP